MKHSVVIVDDHSLVSSALTSMVNNFPKFKVLYEVQNGKELLSKLRFSDNVPDVILLDFNMPEMNGFETMEVLESKFPEVRVLGLSMNDDEESYMKFLELGGSGFISKLASKEVLHDALKSVVEKGYFYTEETTNSLFRKMSSKTSKNVVNLSKRKKQLLSYIGTDLTYQEIAHIMCVSPKTVDGYRNSMFEELNIRSRQGLTVYAIKNGYFKI